MKLVACPDCHAQYDVAPMVPDSSFGCRCGSTLKATVPDGIDAMVLRCGSCGAVAKEGDDDCSYCGGSIVRAPSRGSLICPECMARNLDDARFCLACGVGFAPQAVLSDAPELRCPCCERWMDAREVGGLVVQECPKCHGLWAPDKTLEGLVERAAEVARERAGKGEASTPRVTGDNPALNPVEYRRCPTCDALMSRINFRKRSGVILDHCHDHGTWLDANELERIAGFVLSGRAESAARMDALQQQDKEREEARAAARRMQGIDPNIATDTSSWGSDQSIFGSRRQQPSVVGTIFDLLTSFLH